MKPKTIARGSRQARTRRRAVNSYAELTHVDSAGRVMMVNVGFKSVVHRVAQAHGYLHARKATLDLLERGRLPKGEAVATARLAGICAAKKCADLIPLCHTLPLEAVQVEIERAGATRMYISATVAATAKTGVEMEALVAVSTAALALYDMCKAVDRTMRIQGICVVAKHKGHPDEDSIASQSPRPPAR